MNKKVMTHSIVRFIIQVAFFILLPALFSTAFNGVKYIADQIGKQELITWNPFLTILVVLLVFTIIFGRFFCGYACAFGSLGDWLYSISHFIQKKIRKKVFYPKNSTIKLLQYLKYVVLIGILALCLTGIYSSINHLDPWELFAYIKSSITTGGFSLNGKVLAAIILGLIILGMFLVERFFCQFLCPMGAVFTFMPMLPFTMFNRDKESCLKGCSLCVKTCPANISLGEKKSETEECFQCGKCSPKCPVDNLRLGYKKYKGTEVWIAFGKAVILIAICYPLMNQ